MSSESTFIEQLRALATHPAARGLTDDAATFVTKARGDFSGNTELSSADIDLLSLAIRDNNGRFDLIGDDAVDDLDRLTWVELLRTQVLAMRTSMAASTLPTS